MKELSIEEKAKRYEEALERAKGYHTPDCHTILRIAMENLFPELKESEDEKIRKAIIKLVKKAGEGYENVIDGVSIENAISWLEKQGEQKPTDKIEPKFNVGDWIIFAENRNSVYQVERIDNYRYYLRHYLGGTLSVHFDNELIRLWTIQDAKDGDVLVIESGKRNNECLFIFKDIAGREVLEHCYYRTSDNTFSHTGSYIGYLDNIYHPATKEQSDLLFQKMKEAGYEWDAEKKELKKIEGKPAWSEENIAAVFEKVGLAEIVREQDDDELTKNVLQSVMIELSKFATQPKQEWNEEDKGVIYKIIGLFKFSESFSASGITNNDTKEVENWLKSIRPQKQWKPSEEQMDALEAEIEDCESGVYEILKSLFMDLKTL